MHKNVHSRSIHNTYKISNYLNVHQQRDKLSFIYLQEETLLFERINELQLPETIQLTFKCVTLTKGSKT